MGDVVDLSLTTRSDEELRRLAADGNQDAIAEMARRNRRQINEQRALPSKRGRGNSSQRRPDVGYVSTGRRVSGSGAQLGSRQAGRMTSDASLILRARGGDEAAWTELAKRYDNFVRFVASTYFLPGGEHDDLVQEGLHGLFKAVRDYQASRGAPFRSFAELCIRRQIVTAVKAATRKRRGPLNEYVSFSLPVGAGDNGATLEQILPAPRYHDPVARLCDRADLDELVMGIEELSDLERSVCLGLADGKTYEAVAEDQGVTVKVVDNAIQRAKRKLALAMIEAPSSPPVPAAVGEVRLEESAPEPTLSERIEAFLWQYPGSSTRQIAEGIDGNYHTLRHHLRRGWPGLTKAKKREGKGYCWYMFRRERAAA